jgi:hypothetical protein
MIQLTAPRGSKDSGAFAIGTNRAASLIVRCLEKLMAAAGKLSGSFELLVAMSRGHRGATGLGNGPKIGCSLPGSTAIAGWLGSVPARRIGTTTLSSSDSLGRVGSVKLAIVGTMLWSILKVAPAPRA